MEIGNIFADSLFNIHRVREPIGRPLDAPHKRASKGTRSGCAEHFYHPFALHWKCLRGGSRRDQFGD